MGKTHWCGAGSPGNAAPRVRFICSSSEDAGDVDQQQVHQRWRQDGQPADGIGAGKITGDDGEPDPAQPFEKVVGMARPAPQAVIADLATMGGIGSKATQLPVADDRRRSIANGHGRHRSVLPIGPSRRGRRRPAAPPAREEMPRWPGLERTRTSPAGRPFPIALAARHSAVVDAAQRPPQQVPGKPKAPNAISKRQMRATS